MHGLVATATLTGALLGGSLLAFAAAPASAHGGETVIDVNATPQGPRIVYDVHVTFEEDGHDAAGEAVEVSAASVADPTDVRTTTLPETDASGRASGAIDLAVGQWTVTFSTDDGTRTITQDVTAEGGDETLTTEPGSETTAPVTTEPAEPTTTEAPVAIATATSDENDDDGNGGSIALIVVGAVVLLGALGAVVLRKRSAAGTLAGPESD